MPLGELCQDGNVYTHTHTHTYQGYTHLREKSVKMAKEAEAIAQRAVSLASDGHDKVCMCMCVRVHVCMKGGHCTNGESVANGHVSMCIFPGECMYVCVYLRAEVIAQIAQGLCGYWWL